MIKTPSSVIDQIMILVSLIIFLSSVHQARAAEVSLISYNYSAAKQVPHIHIEGDIKRGDLKKLERELAKIGICDGEWCTNAGERLFGGSHALITLNSHGGNFAEGIKFASYFRKNFLATRIETGSRCISACAVAFLGGSGFWLTGGVGTFVDRVIEPGGKVGFHSPYFNLHGIPTDEAVDGIRNQIALLVEELVKYDVDEKIIHEIILKGKNEVWQTETAFHLFLLNATMPAFPLEKLKYNDEKKVFNACLFLVIDYYQTTLKEANSTLLDGWVPAIHVQPNGQTLSGFGVDDRPLDVSFCGARTSRDGSKIDLEHVALYSMDFSTETANTVTSLFNRNDYSWSSAGFKDRATTRNKVVLGSLNYFMMQADQAISELIDEVAGFLSTEKHNLEMPELRLSLAGIDQFQRTDGAYEKLYNETMNIFIRRGDLELFSSYKEIEFKEFTDLTYERDFTDVFVRSGNYQDGFGGYYLFGLSYKKESAIVRIDVSPTEKRGINSSESELIIKIACRTTLAHVSLPCGS